MTQDSTAGQSPRRFEATAPQPASAAIGDDPTGEWALPPALPGTASRVPTASGMVNVYEDGAGAPLLLIHSVNAAASAAEVRPLHEHFRHGRRVFSLDLPGYGLSDRSDLDYSPALMTDAILQVVTWIEGLCGRQPIDALALSLASEYLAQAAAARPESFRSLALVSPTGFRGSKRLRGAPGSSRGIPWVYRALRGPRNAWGRGLFGLLTRPAVIRYFLERTWGSKRIDEELWRYDVLTARVRAAEFAPLRFLSGYLFTGDAHTTYERLRTPVWMCHGVRGDFTDYRNQRIVADRANWRFTTYATGALPHFEIPQQFCKDYESFMAGLDAAQGVV